MKRVAVTAVGCAAVILLGGCTNPGEKTKIGAGAGGGLGAGLGAIVGSQVGAGGAGLVIGGTAGAGAGGMIGNALDQQDQSIRNQSEAIERQKKLISAQKGELDDLRRMSNDQISYRGDSGSEAGRGEFGRGRDVGTLGDNSHFTADVPEIRRDSPLKERSLGETDRDTSRGSMGWEQSAAETREIVERERAPQAASFVSRGSPSSDRTPECVEADDEAKRGEKSADSADKLFHFRRALRLCPTEARFHAGIANVYSELNRKSDAVFELKEALKYDSSNPEYRSRLSSLGG